MPVNKPAMNKAPFSDVVTMWATIVDYSSYVFDNDGSTFIQSLCYHLVVSQGGRRITGGDSYHDLDAAFVAITQDVSSQPIRVGPTWKWNERTWEWKEVEERVNQTPIYQSTACGKKVGFKVVAKEKRCKQILHYRFAKEIAGFATDIVGDIIRCDSRTLTFRVKLDEVNEIDVILQILPFSVPLQTLNAE